jgi:hypothetical protein
MTHPRQTHDRPKQPPEDKAKPDLAPPFHHPAKMREGDRAADESDGGADPARAPEHLKKRAKDKPEGKPRGH